MDPSVHLLIRLHRRGANVDGKVAIVINNEVLYLCHDHILKGSLSMPHPLVNQLRFTRSEFLRAVKGISDEDARKRLVPMNCISWKIGHLAWQEQRYFLHFGQGKMLFPDINESFAYGAPASTPALEEVLAAWKAITKAADPWLNKLTSSKLQEHVISNGKQIDRIYGN